MSAWEPFSDYRQTVTAATLDSLLMFVSRTSTRGQRAWCFVFLMFLLGPPAVFVAFGAAHLGNPVALGLGALPWPVVLELTGRAKRLGRSVHPSGKVFAFLSLVELALFVGFDVSVGGHPVIPHLLHGVPLALGFA